MTQASPAPARRPIFEKDEVDLRQLAKAVWRYRWMVIVLGLAGGLAGIALAMASTRYVSTGLFLTPQLKIATYKQYEVAINNEARLEEFLRLSGTDGEAAALLRRMIHSPVAMAQAVKPAFSFTGGDARSYDIDLRPDDESRDELVGIRLTMERGERSGPAPVLVLAEYVRSIAIQVDLRETLLDQCLGLQLREQELRNAELQDNFQISQLESKAGTLRRLIQESPGAATIEARQLVSLENNGERFLSPAAQLVAVEVGATDLRLAGIKRARERVAALLKKEYYCRGRAAQEQPTTGQELLAALATLRMAVFAGQNPTEEIVELTGNEIDIQRQAWSNRYLDRMRFVASPEGAESRVRSPSLRVGGMLGGILGGLLGLVLSFGLAWWHDNRDAVMARDV